MRELRIDKDHSEISLIAYYVHFFINAITSLMHFCGCSVLSYSFPNDNAAFFLTFSLVPSFINTSSQRAFTIQASSIASENSGR